MVFMNNSLEINKGMSDPSGDMFDNSQNYSSDGVDLPTAFDENLGDEIKDQNINLEHTISIDSSGLDDISKKANIQDILEYNRMRDIEKDEFDTEIMSIIGSINSRH